MDKEYLYRIIDSVKLGLVYTDEAGVITYANFPAEKYLNSNREELLGIHIRDCHPAIINTKISDVFSEVMAGESFEEIITVAGRYIECRCSPVRDHCGFTTGLAAVLTDVSEKVHLQNDLKRSWDEMKIFHEASQIMNSSLELKHILTRLMEIIKRVVKYSSCSIYIYNEEAALLNIEAHDEKLTNLIKDPEPEIILQKVFDTGVSIYQEGELIKLFIPLKRSNEVLGVIYMLIEDTEEISDHVQWLLINLASLACLAIKNAQMFQRIHELATMDGLTKLYNRQYFDIIFTQEANRSKRFRIPLSLIMIDVNGLKEINDSLGHTVGDLILVETAKVMQEMVRSIDYVFRYGGDEMVILLVEANEETAELVSNRIKDRVWRWNEERENKEPVLSLSIGFASTKGGVDADDLLVRADRLMYQNKEEYYRDKFSRLLNANMPR